MERVFEESGSWSFTTRVVPEQVLRADVNAAADDSYRGRGAVVVNSAHRDRIDVAAPLARFPVPVTWRRNFADRVSPGC